MTATIEQVRAYWDRKPCDVEQSSEPPGSKAFSEDLERYKDRAEPHIRALAQHERWRGKRVLEIGCGVGTDTVRFARAGAQVTAIDLSPRSIEVTRQRLAALGLQARLVCGNAEELGALLEPGPYDLIYSYGVIHHSPRPGRIVQELRAFTGPGTELRIMLYARWSTLVLGLVLKRGRGAFWRAGELVREYGEAQRGCPVTYCYSARGVRRLLQGFEVREVRKAGLRLPLLWERRLHASPTLARLRPVLERHLGWNILVVARPREA